MAFKDKPLRTRGALVGAMFRAELETGLLTAGHDADLLVGRLTIDVVDSGDAYTGIGGRAIEAAPGDMCIRDEAGIVSSVVYGPDDRTRLQAETRAAVFTTYAPAGIGRDAVARHLEAIVAGVRVVTPDSVVEGPRDPRSGLSRRGMQSNGSVLAARVGDDGSAEQHVPPKSQAGRSAAAHSSRAAAGAVGPWLSPHGRPRPDGRC